MRCNLQVANNTEEAAARFQSQLIINKYDEYIHDHVTNLEYKVNSFKSHVSKVVSAFSFIENIINSMNNIL